MSESDKKDQVEENCVPPKSQGMYNGLWTLLYVHTGHDGNFEDKFVDLIEKVFEYGKAVERDAHNGK